MTAASKTAATPVATTASTTAATTAVTITATTATTAAAGPSSSGLKTVYHRGNLIELKQYQVLI